MTNRRGWFLDRPNRFVALVRLEDGAELAVHVASSGRMRELLLPGAEVVVTMKSEPGRRTAGLLTMVRSGGTWVSVDTGLPGRLIREALDGARLAPFQSYSQVRPEFTYGTSRLDFLLTAPGLRPCLVEVKSVTSAVPDAEGHLVARFPDAPTARGSRHLHELARAVSDGYRAAVCFVVQRSDAVACGPWDDIDPDFGTALRAAVSAGVEAYAWCLHADPEKVSLKGRLPLRI